MAEPFFGEIRMFGGGTVPAGWLPCDGTLMPINQNQALFSLLGTLYGGDGETTFALPDLRGRVAMHRGQVLPIGQRGGEAAHALTQEEMPPHSHTMNASTAVPTSGEPAAHVVGAAPVWSAPGGQATPLSPAAIGNAGGGQPHLNMQPYLALTLCIAVTGIFPLR
jgi:microcystin-dependent protein